MALFSGQKTIGTVRFNSLILFEKARQSTPGCGSSSMSPPVYKYEHSTRICSELTVLSSIMSISFILAPNSRNRCSGSPYVSHAFCSRTCRASPSWSSNTSMSSSNCWSMLFQYSTTSFSDVHRRRMTSTGMFVRGRRASATFPSEDSPSVAIITVTFWLFARSTSAMDWIDLTTALMWLHKGVGPAGLSDITSFKNAKLLPLSSPRPTMIGSEPFSRRNSLGAPSSSESSPRNFIVPVSSSHRVHFTIFV
mmetsp:Transcript_28397/g.48728  ORF Transcript_28397/g.48728 Transcript_28397/m.48728 type:complete len:251 (-) Transcript_28397:518-1270(-)